MRAPSKLMNRNFLLLWQGQTVSLLGNQAFNIAMLLWLKEATNSATLIGLILMVSSLPIVLLSPIGGTLADRYARRTIIIVSDVVNGMAVLLLAVLMFTAAEATETIIVALFVVSILSGVVNSFFGPAISAAIPDLVPKDKVASANSMGQLASELTVFIGQGAGGVLFRLLGGPMLFLLDGLTYLFSAASEWFITIPQTIPDKSSAWREQLAEFKRDTVEGFHYIWHKAGLRELVFASALLNFFTIPIIVLLPFYVEDFLKVTVDWYGFLLAAYSAGSLLGYLSAGLIQLSGRTRGKLMLLFFFLEPVGYGILGLITSVSAALVLAFLGGLMGGFVLINITTILQIATPGQIRGRVFGLLTTIAGSTTPLAMGLTGIVADLVNQNIPLIYGACGGIMLLLLGLVSLKRDFRQFLTCEQAADETETEELPAEVKSQVISLS